MDLADLFLLAAAAVAGYVVGRIHGLTDTLSRLVSPGDHAHASGPTDSPTVELPSPWREREVARYKAPPGMAGRACHDCGQGIKSGQWIVEGEVVGRGEYGGGATHRIKSHLRCALASADSGYRGLRA